MKSRLNFFAIGLGLIAIAASFIIMYVAYHNSLRTTEANLYHFYRNNVKLMHAIIHFNHNKTDAELLDVIEKTFLSIPDKPDDEYLCIVDSNCNLILHTKYPNTIGNSVATNKLLGSVNCTLNDLVIKKQSFTGDYISSTGEEQIAVFEYIDLKNWTIGLHRSREIVDHEVMQQYQLIWIALIITCFVLLPLSMGILLWASTNSFKRKIEIEMKSKEQLLQFNNELDNAKKQIEESETKYKKIVSIMPDGVVIHCNGKVRFINDTTAKLFKIKNPKDVIGWDVFDFVHPDYKELALQRITKSLKEGIASHNIEEVFIDSEGNEIYVYVSAIPIVYEGKQSVLTVFTDITPLKRIEMELNNAKEKAQENERKFRILFNAMQEGVYLHEVIYDTKGKAINYRILEANAISEKYLHIKPDQAIGKLATEVFATSQAPFIDMYAKVAETGEPYAFETYFESMNKHFYISAFSPQKGQFATAFLDITKDKNAEEELVLAKEKAEESDRLKTAFLQNMSHEIRTPMNAIMGFSSLLDRPNLSDEKRKSFVSIIQNSSSQLLAIVTDILTVSSLETKQEKTSIEKVSINTIIDNLALAYKPQALSQNIRLSASCDVHNRQSEIYTDKTKITQILTNLISNALKFTPKGSVTFGYKKVNKGQKVFLQFFVKDTGIGIKEEHQKIIFERFQQAETGTNKKYGGTGLGLSISKAFVELLGGEMWVESQINQGTTFFFTLPYNPVNESEPGKPASEPNLEKHTILVAEDELYNFLLIEEMLIDSNCTLIHAKNGREALDICKENNFINLVLMDIKMPVLDGYAAAKLIKEIKAEIPIIAQSAYALEHEIEKYSGIFDDYITKPIEEDNLIEKINKYLIVS